MTLRIAICLWFLPRMVAAQLIRDVTELGAVPDGVSDCSAAINAAIKSLPADGGTVFLPSGVYAIGRDGILINRSNVTLRGATADSSILHRIERSAPVLQSSGSGEVQHHLRLENLTFSGNRSGLGGENTALAALYGNHIADIEIQSCRFVNMPAVGIALSGTAEVTIDRCIFRGAGDARSTSISLTASPRDITISRSRFLYVRDGIVVDTGDGRNPSRDPARGLKITGNYFDLGWWLIKAQFAGEGSGIGYTANSLVNRDGSFEHLLTKAQQNIRVMPVKQTGTANYTEATIEDASANFRRNDLRRGDIVRAEARFAVVTQVLSETSVQIEEWLSDSEFALARPPKAGLPYTAYGLILGQIRGFTPSRVSTTRWWDFDGNTVTPAPGTRYEILVRRPNYPLHVETGGTDITVSGNTFKRGWSDQVSVWGDNAVITDNVIEDGEDMGVTLHGRGHRVSGNRIRHQGAGGVWLSADDSLIRDNHITDSQWVNYVNRDGLGDIMIDQGDRNTIEANLCERFATVLGRNGIVIGARHRASTANVLRKNISRGHLSADFRIIDRPGARVLGTILEANEGNVAGQP